MFFSIVDNFPKLKKSQRKYTTQVNRAYGPVSDPPKSQPQRSSSPKPKVKALVENKIEEGHLSKTKVVFENKYEEPAFLGAKFPQRQDLKIMIPSEERLIEPGFSENFLNFPEERKGENPMIGRNNGEFQRHEQPFDIPVPKERIIEKSEGGYRPNAEAGDRHRRKKHQEEPAYVEQPRHSDSDEDDIGCLAIDCKFETCRLIETNNLHFDTQRAFRDCSITLDTESIVIQAKYIDLPEVQSRVEELVKKFTFDDNAKWLYLENHGYYKEYPQEQNRMIESEYKKRFHLLLSPTYENYTEKIKLKLQGADYLIEFARIGGVHRQIRVQASGTVRAVQRQAEGENLNKGFKRTFQWYWEDEDGYNLEYNSDANFLIEQSYIEYKTKAYKSVVLFQGTNGMTYTIHFDEMMQSNEVSSFKRKVLREDIP